MTKPDPKSSLPQDGVTGRGEGPSGGASGSEAAAAGTDLTPSEKSSLDPTRKMLRERAIKLAQRPDTEEREEAFLAVIEFRLAHERYAIEVEFVGEVYPFKDLTIVPCTPSFILGIINVRGQVISVMDIREFFNLPRREVTEQDRVLVLENGEMELGIVTESVAGERKIPLSDIQTEVGSIRGIRHDYVRGVTVDGLIVINGEKLLSDERIVVHEEVGD